MSTAFGGHNDENRKRWLQSLNDLESITLADVSFASSTKHKFGFGKDISSREERLSPFSMEVKLGQLYRVVNRDNDNSNTCLLYRIIAGQVFPTSGIITIPPHLSIRVVQPIPMLSSISLLANLRMGLDLLGEKIKGKLSDSLLFDVSLFR
jgi:hypothetical protein